MMDEEIDDNDVAMSMSDNICRTCGRIGCEGGPSCEMAAEQRHNVEASEK